MDAVLTDSHLDNKVKTWVLINAVVPKLEHAGEAWKQYIGPQPKEYYNAQARLEIQY